MSIINSGGLFMEKLKTKYGLFTAICMVVGIVIGSGIFFKANVVLQSAGYNALYSILAWLISGLIMVVIATTFAVMATKYEKVNGAVDYAEATCGKKYAYYIGWFMSMIYYPAMTGVLAWVTARFTLAACGYIEAPLFAIDSLKSSMNSPECITLALFYLILAFFVNTIAPKIAGKFQISSTIIKLIPIVFIAVVGTVIGLVNGSLGANFEYFKLPENEVMEGAGLFPAICSTIFAYDGWIVATAINSELKNSKKNLPIALCLGTLIIVTVYTLYNIGILGLAGIGDIKNEGTVAAFKFFGGLMSSVINVFVIVSCMGTLNGLMVGCSRGIYSLSARGEGIAPETFSQIDKKTNMPHNSSILALMIAALWFVYFILFGSGLFSWGKLDEFCFDSSELPIITLYALYIPILISIMIKEKDLNPLKRFVLPALSIVGIGVIIYASIDKHGIKNVWYLAVFAVIMLIGYLVSRFNKKQAE